MFIVNFMKAYHLVYLSRREQFISFARILEKFVGKKVASILCSVSKQNSCF